MAWQDRNYNRDPRRASLRDVARRIFGDGENPLSWGVLLYRALGIDVRIHIAFIIWIIAEIIGALPQGNIGIAYRLLGIGSLFLLVLLHEYGHCLWCRWVGGEADQILLWPLGGLAYCRPPHHWKAHLITVLGGPGVHVMLWPIFAAILWVLVGNAQILGALFFNPFSPGAVLAGLRLSSGEHSYVLAWLWWMYYMNMILFMFNMLIPMYPMDAGRALQAVLWRRMGYEPSLRLAVKIGLGAAVALAVFAIVGRGHTLLLLIAILGGITCWTELRRLQFESTGDPYAPPPKIPAARKAAESPRARARRERQEAERRQAVDRVLDKIRVSGMGSLTAKERALLRGETRRQRKARQRKDDDFEP